MIEKCNDLVNKRVTIDNEARDLRASLAGTPKSPHRVAVQARIDELSEQAAEYLSQAKDASAAADRLYWPIYNLDLKNPNTPEEESHDPDVLLDKYAKLLGQIQETQNRLRSELGAALAHHVVGDAA